MTDRTLTMGLLPGFLPFLWFGRSVDLLLPGLRFCPTLRGSLGLYLRRLLRFLQRGLVFPLQLHLRRLPHLTNVLVPG